MVFARPSGAAWRLGAAAVAVATGAALLVATGAGAAPDKPKPTIASVTAQLDHLAHRAEVLTEKYNAARLDVQRRERAAAQAKRDAAVAQRRYAAARRPLMRIAVAQYQGAPPSTVGALLSSDDQQAYLDSLTAFDMLTTRFARLAALLNAAKARAESTQKRAEKALAHARDARDALSGQRDKVVSQTGRFRSLLASLTAAEQQAYTSRNAPSPSEVQAAFRVRAPNAAAQRAVDFALAQIGKPYVWAAAGPDAYDCSGLTLAAWRQGGVILPHLSQAQYLLGRHVSYDQMLPGDLVFLYPDIHHVELYIGNGLAVSAPQEGEPIKIVRVADEGYFAGATRLR